MVWITLYNGDWALPIFPVYSNWSHFYFRGCWVRAFIKQHQAQSENWWLLVFIAANTWGFMEKWGKKWHHENSSANTRPNLKTGGCCRWWVPENKSGSCRSSECSVSIIYCRCITFCSFCPAVYCFTDVTMETREEIHKIFQISTFFPQNKPSEKSKRVICGIILKENDSTLSVQNFKTIRKQ